MSRAVKISPFKADDDLVFTGWYGTNLPWSMSSIVRGKLGDEKPEDGKLRDGKPEDGKLEDAD